MHLEIIPINNTLMNWNLIVRANKADAADHPTRHEAMNGPNGKGYKEARKLELYSLETKMDIWEDIPKEPWMRVIPSTCAFYCKCFPMSV